MVKPQDFFRAVTEEGFYLILLFMCFYLWINTFWVDTVPLNPSTLIICISDYLMHKYHLDFFKARPHFLISAKLHDLQFPGDVEIYMTFTVLRGTRFSSSNTAGTLASLKHSLPWLSSINVFKHRLNLQTGKVPKHIILIWMHTLKLMSHLHFKRPESR